MRTYVIVAIVVVGALMFFTSSAQGEKPKVEVKHPTIEWMKPIVGDWYLVVDGKTTEQCILKSRVTAGGSAIEEIIFPGAPHEMVTMYYKDGDRLMLTHYCALGNQPSMRAEFGKDKKELNFMFVGATNFKKGDMHMHEGHVRILGKDHIKTAWKKYTDGKHDGTHGFELRRVSK